MLCTYMYVCKHVYIRMCLLQNSDVYLCTASCRNIQFQLSWRASCFVAPSKCLESPDLQRKLRWPTKAKRKADYKVSSRNWREIYSNKSGVTVCVLSRTSVNLCVSPLSCSAKIAPCRFGGLPL